VDLGVIKTAPPPTECFVSLDRLPAH